MAAPSLQIAEQATAPPSLMAQWNDGSDMAGITLASGKVTVYAALLANMTESQPEMGSFLLGGRSQPPYGATTSGRHGALELGKPSIKQALQCLGDKYRDLPAQQASSQSCSPSAVTTSECKAAHLAKKPEVYIRGLACSAGQLMSHSPHRW